MANTERVIRCIETDVILDWPGYGRPPKYAPDVRKRLDNERRKARRKQKAEEARRLKGAQL